MARSAVLTRKQLLQPPAGRVVDADCFKLPLYGSWQQGSGPGTVSCAGPLHPVDRSRESLVGPRFLSLAHLDEKAPWQQGGLQSRRCKVGQSATASILTVLPVRHSGASLQVVLLLWQTEPSVLCRDVNAEHCTLPPGRKQCHQAPVQCYIHQ